MFAGLPPKFLLTAAAVLAMSACGQKGPLYVPDSTGEVITRPTQSPPNTPPPPPAEGGDREDPKPPPR